MRDFEKWLSQFRISICDYGYYINFGKVYENVDEIKAELALMGTLIGSPESRIEADFRSLVEKYPQVMKCIPTLIAVREREIYADDETGTHIFDFKNYSNSIDDYSLFMREIGLFELLSKHLIANLYDYAIGVETGLDSNGRKNRGGHLMEDRVEKYIKETGCEYYKEMYLSEIEDRWKIDLSVLSNSGGTRKRFDFVVKTPSQVYGIETNFYKGTGGGSKLNETARSYKMLAQESSTVNGFTFVWITDGTAWRSARGNLKETFDVLETMYNLVELESGVLKEVFV